MSSPSPALAILYEHPSWMAPLFAALTARGVAHERLSLPGLSYDPAEPAPPAPVVFNRVSQSAPSRQGADAHGVLFAETLLERWEEAGADVINPARAFRVDRDKAAQLALIRRLGFDIPKTRVIHRAQDAADAAQGLSFPVLVKANLSGGGAGITAFETIEQLRDAGRVGAVPMGVDGVALVQERAPLRGGKITRIETLGGRFLYAIDVYPQNADAFDLCPADACQIDDGPRIVGAEPPEAWIRAAETIAQAAGVDVGGVEILVDDRDGRACVFDINAMSNFVADAPAVIGFDPYEPLTDMIVARIKAACGEES